MNKLYKDFNPAVVLGWMTTPKCDKDGVVKEAGKCLDILDIATCIHTAENGSLFVQARVILGETKHIRKEAIKSYKTRLVNFFRGDGFADDFVSWTNNEYKDAFGWIKRGTAYDIQRSDLESAKDRQQKDLDDLKAFNV